MGYIGVISASAILAFSFLVMKLYWPIGIGRWGKRYGQTGAEIYFAHGVVVGFFAAFLNALVWKITIRAMRYMGEDPRPLLEWGNYFDAFIMMPLMTWAAYCHLYSAWLKLPKKERSEWSWLTRAFYPRRSALVDLLDCVTSRLQIQGKSDVYNRRQK